MKKKITKLIIGALPQRLYNKEGELVNRRSIAERVYDAIPNIEKLDLHPFTMWIPLECASCKIYNQGHKMGCTYNLFSEKTHIENPAPDNCPLGYKL